MKDSCHRIFAEQSRPSRESKKNERKDLGGLFFRPLIHLISITTNQQSQQTAKMPTLIIHIDRISPAAGYKQKGVQTEPFVELKLRKPHRE